MNASKTGAVTADAETRDRAECGASLIVGLAQRNTPLFQQGMHSSIIVSGRKRSCGLR
jgi:hypothetical protein